jgi:hypothetical protein
MCVSTDYPHFDSNFPNVSNNLLRTVPRAIAAQILLGGAGLYGFTGADPFTPLPRDPTRGSCCELTPGVPS